MTYELLDSGYFKKLEKIGGQIMCRPCPQACWAPILPKEEWKKAKDTYLRSNKGGGKWQSNSLPSDWMIEYKGQNMLIRPTNFGHLGIFAEAAGNWEWLREQAKPGIKALNMFAYTGGSSIAMAKGGAEVTHLDAAKGIVDWAKINAKENNLSNIRWIVDDANRFLDREIRRGNKYDALVMDPPSYGRGSKGEIWKIEDDIMPYLQRCADVLSDNPAFILFTCHTPHFTPKVLENLAYTVWGENLTIESGEMTIPQKSSKRTIPSGFYARIIFNDHKS
jgi:23S rRNA (cytosine1962-C5)-methyltransferase